MKRTYQMILGLAASILLVPGAFAQNLTVPYEIKNGIGYNKSVTTSSTHTDGYIIDLEAFVTGKVTVVTGYKPVDIAIVLDKSGSMEEAVPNTYIQESHFNYAYVNRKKSPLFDINDYDNKNYNYYYKDGDAYYLIEAVKDDFRDTQSGDRVTRYILQYKKNGKNYLIGPDGPVQANATKAVTSQLTVWTEEGKTCSFTKNQGGANADTQWFPNDNVYRYKSRIEVLKDAVKNFVTSIAYYDTHDSEGKTVASVGHQIAIVSFSSDVVTTHPFSGVSDAEVTEINNAIDGIETTGFTQTDLGVQRAVSLINALTNREEASKVIVVFTDGNPGGSTTFDTTIASNAIGYAQPFKATTGKVYTIGMINNPSDNAKNFLNYLSSNYPNAASMTDPGTVDSKGKYYQLASGSDLSSIFEAIAEEAAGGAGNMDVTAEASVMTDIVSSSFLIPEDANDEVEILVAKNTGIGSVDGYEGNEWLQFDTPITAGEFNAAHDGENIAFTIDRNRNTIHVSGFNYSGHWCGPDESDDAENGVHKDGYKLILRFPIEINESAIGGPAVRTNASGSGIYVNDDPIITFNEPVMHSPSAYLVIAKQGLADGETAEVTIQRRAASAEDLDPVNNPDYDPDTYVDYMKVLFIGGQQVENVTIDGTEVPCSVVRINGLDADYYYRIKETGWSWTYEGGAVTPLTSKTLTNNPFILTNEKQVPAVKNAESVKRNEFN